MTGAAADAVLTGWGRTGAVRTTLHHPSDAGEAADIIASAGSRGAVARGRGRSYGDAAQNAGGATIATDRLTAIRSFDRESGLLRAGAGCTIDELLRLTVPDGWLPPVMPGTRHVSLGGSLAADVHGKNHHRDGSFAAHVPAFALQTPGQGRLEVDPLSHPDVFAATAGGMGLTGVVVEVELQLRRIETAQIVAETIRADDLDQLMAALIDADGRHRHTVAWLDLLAAPGRLGRGLVDAGDHATIADLPPSQRDQALRPIAKRVLTMPRLPLSPLSITAVRAANAARYRSATPGRALVEMAGFFHPLDRMSAWNRVYGPGGLVQHQFVVPDGAAAAVQRVIELYRAARAPVYLAVLKRFGPGGGLLSFPIEGWTLAADLPATWPPLGALLDRIDELVVEAGGRVYLAKDGRMRPDLLAAMYPELPRWREIANGCDPGRALQSDLSRRLGL